MEKNNKNSGFTLIELLVVVAIIGLLSSVALIAFLSAREKSRNAKRLSDMVQMLNALELFNAHNRGYPADADSNGIPDGLSPIFASTIPRAPLPADSAICANDFSPCGGVGQPACVSANTYWYVPLGASSVVNGVTVYPNFDYYFCLGDQTGNFQSGVRTLSQTGVE